MVLIQTDDLALPSVFNFVSLLFSPWKLKFFFRTYSSTPHPNGSGISSSKISLPKFFTYFIYLVVHTSGKYSSANSLTWILKAQMRESAWYIRVNLDFSPWWTWVGFYSSSATLWFENGYNNCRVLIGANEVMHAHKC